jgi:hypothetical protein
MQQIEFNVKNLTNAPNQIDWRAYNSLGEFITQGTSNLLGSTPTANGILIKIFVFPELPTIADLYSIEINVKDDLGIERVYIKDLDLTTLEPEFKTTDYLTLTTSISINLPEGFISAQLFDENELKVEFDNTFNGQIDLTDFTVKLEPYTLILYTDKGFITERIYYINASILQAISDLSNYINRLNSTMRLNGLQFDDIDYLSCLNAGKNRFNLIGLSTNFTMTNATGAIKEYWLLCAQIHALRVRYLEEGLTSFNYEGAAVKLDVDVTQYIETTVQALESRLDTEGINLKKELHKRNLKSGDGRYTFNRLPIGAYGTTLSPVHKNNLYNIYRY